MAAPVSNDRKLAATVRRLALKEVEKILLGKDEIAKREMVFKLAPNLMPRLNEHTGEGGKDLFPKPLLAGKSNVSSNHSLKEVITTCQTD